MKYNDIEKWFDSSTEGILRNSNSSSHLDKIANYILEKCEFEEGHSILEVGCGDGMILASIIEKRPDLKITGLDISSNQINKAKILLPDIEFYVGNFLETEINNEFNAIFSFSTFQYIKKEDVNIFNKKCLDLVVPSGKVHHLSIPNRQLRRAYYYRNIKENNSTIVAWPLSLLRNLSSKYGKDGSNWHDPNYIKNSSSKYEVIIDCPSDSWYRFNFHLVK